MLETWVNALVKRTANGWKFCGSTHMLPAMVPKKMPAAPWTTVLPLP